MLLLDCLPFFFAAIFQGVVKQLRICCRLVYFLESPWIIEIIRLVECIAKMLQMWIYVVAKAPEELISANGCRWAMNFKLVPFKWKLRREVLSSEMLISGCRETNVWFFLRDDCKILEMSQNQPRVLQTAARKVFCRRQTLPRKRQM